MLTHSDLAVLAGRSYAGPQSGRVALDVRYDLIPAQNELAVVCPGTHPGDPLDWVRDLSAWPAWIAGVGTLHSGFGEGAEALWARLAPDIAKETRRIVFVGHSLGGALAQALAALHAANALPRCRVVTFGAPRVGWLDPYFSHLVRRAAEAVEYQRDGDIVPDLPACWLGFNHPTRRVRIGKSAGNFIDNHSIARYAADLAAAQA